MADIEDFNYQVLDLPLKTLLVAYLYRRLQKKPADIMNMPPRVIFQKEERLLNSVFSDTNPPNSRLSTFLHKEILSLIEREKTALDVLEDAGVTSLYHVYKKGDK